MRFVVIGNGKMAGDVLHLIHRTAGAEAVGAIGDPSQEAAQSRLAITATGLNVPYFSFPDINQDDALAIVRMLQPTYIISANNFQIFRESARGLAERGIINFHNGPLPRYGGLNACSWALFNGEKEHGVTWHLVDNGIDSGPILIQRMFPILPEERAITLIARCIKEGVSLFGELLASLLAGTLMPEAQRPVERLYYGHRDRPFGGYLPWWDAVDVLYRLSCALGFHPLPNNFYRPSLNVAGYAPVFAGEMSVKSEGSEGTGTVRICERGYMVSLPRGAVVVDALFDTDGCEIDRQELMERHGIVDGAALARP